MYWINYFLIEPDKWRIFPLQSALIELSMVPFGSEITFFTFEIDLDFFPLTSVSRTFDAFIESEPFARFKLKSWWKYRMATNQNFRIVQA